MPRITTKVWKDELARNEDIAKAILLQLDYTSSKLRIKLYDDHGRLTDSYRRLVAYVDYLFSHKVQESESSSQIHSTIEKIQPKKLKKDEYI